MPALDWPSLLADDDGALTGVLTYAIRDRSCEVLTIHAAPPARGIGTALLGAVERIAVEQGCRRRWLITTNDNLDALRFYQRRGFHLTLLHRGAVDESRARLKPEIPTIGDYGIVIRDEIELSRSIG